MRTQKFGEKRIAAVVVTYNRKNLLLECLSAILAQEGLASYSVSLNVIVIDNASTDGTGEMLRAFTEEMAEILLYYNTGSNLGGAGGFQYGIRKAVELSYDYLWLMDDDCIPSPTALWELLRASVTVTAEHPYKKANARTCKDRIGIWGFLSSKVLWKDGTLCEMNAQRETLTKDVKDFTSGQIRSVVMASFVSLFVPAAVVKELGLPIKEFFLWTDDWEWTRRISRKHPCYLVTDSVVTHKSNTNIGADIAAETPDRLARFRYLYRNDVVLYRREGLKGFAYECIRLTWHSVKVLLRAKDHKWERIKTIISATMAGMRFHPRIEYVDR